MQLTSFTFLFAFLPVSLLFLLLLRKRLPGQNAALLILSVLFCAASGLAGFLAGLLETLAQEDQNAATACLFADCASLLSALGLKRGTGSMLELYEGVENRFGAENADKLREMTLLNARALFSTKALTNEERTSMENYRSNVLHLLKTNIKWPKKLRLKWLSCLY